MVQRYENRPSDGPRADAGEAEKLRADFGGAA
jgi:hypothetical protein